jgi:membrane protease YdiL (CAAX protease family)
MLLADKTYRDQFWIFAVPYGLYVLGNSLGGSLGPQMAATLGGVLSCASLIYFAAKGHYRFDGMPKPMDWIWTLVLGTVAVVAWILAYRYSASLLAGGVSAMESQAKEVSQGYWIARGIASTLVIPIAEELFVRAYVLRAVHAHQSSQKSQGPTWIWQKTLDLKPSEAALFQVTWKASLLAGLVFTLGHAFVAWLPAVIWFAITQVLYWKTRNIVTVILAHVMANGFITYLVGSMKMTWLW